MCTGIKFTDKEGNLYMGRNLDWTCGYGQSVFVTPKGHKRTWAFEPVKEAVGAIVGMAIVVNDMPLYFDCGNDQGLYIGGLNFPGISTGKYEAGPIEGKTNIAAYEFPFWVASNFTTVDDVEKALENLAIVAKQVNDEFPVAYLHWIIGDKDRTIVVEYYDGMHVYDDPVDCLTNEPEFSYMMHNLRNYVNVSPEWAGTATWGKYSFTPFDTGGGQVGLPGDVYSPSRFVRVAYYNTHYPEQEGEANNVMRLFRTLQMVAQIYGGAKAETGDYEYTLYTGGYSQAEKAYYYNTYNELAPRIVRISDAPEGSDELYTSEGALCTY